MKRRGFKGYVMGILVSVDQLGNAILRGDEDETISSRAAKARQDGKRWGCVLCKALDWIDKDHCAQAIEPDEGEKVSQ